MEKIQARFIIEILGRPIENVKTALVQLMEKLSKEKGVKVLEKTIHEPHALENSKDLFTSFAEISAEFDSIANYITVIFGYMPSHIEIIQPEEFVIRNADLNEMANIIIQRLHSYDAIVKGVINERAALAGKLKEVAPHLFKKESQEAINPNEVEDVERDSKDESTKSEDTEEKN